jgi:hypothetical protein
MRSKSVLIFISIAVAMAAAPIRAQTSEGAAPYQFATAYVHTLAGIEEVRDKVKKDVSKSNVDTLTNCIRNMEAFQLELSGDVEMLKSIHLTGKVGGVPNTFAQFFEDERDTYRQMGEGCADMLQGPKPGVDYGALVANAPKLSARLEYLDESIFKVSPMVFATLIRERPDAQNHMSHLSITKAQMGELAHTIRLDFGKKLDQETQNYTVSAASTLYSYLTKRGYKGSDEP